MGLYRKADGTTVTVPDEQAGGGVASGALTPVTAAEAGAPVESDASGGAIGTLGSFASGGLSGATLGASDLALKGLLSKGEFARLRADREEHPVANFTGQLAGAIASGGAGAGTFAGSMPAGYLARATAGIAERGGGSLAAKALATGLEGAGQNAGIYLSDVALGDRDLSAQGITGALGTGFAFGAGTSVAAHGIEQGTIAARRMFARVAEGGDKAAREAAQEWATHSATLTEAYDQTADIARAKLAAAQAEREQAGLARQRASADVAEARVAAPVVDEARAPLVALDSSIGKIEAQEAAERIAGPAALNEGGSGPRVNGLEDLQKLADHLDEYVAARREFDEVRAAVDPDLEAAMQGLGEIEVQTPGSGGVPVGEFGAPGERGIKSGDELVPRQVTETGTPPPVQDPTRALKRPAAFADGTPVGALENKPDVRNVPKAAPLADAEFENYKQSYGHAASNDHFAAEMFYSKGGDELINPALRSGKTLDATETKLRDNLDDAFNLPESRLKRDTTLYRGMSDDPIMGATGVRARFEHAKPGDVIEDPAYTSTAYSEQAKSRNEHVVFTIHAPAGTPALPIRSKFTSEGELLLPRNTRLRVDKIEYVPVTERWQHLPDKYEVLPDKSVKMWERDGSVSVRPPIKDIHATLISEHAPVSIERTPRVDLSAPVDQLSKRQLGEYQEEITKAFETTKEGTPEYKALSDKWDAAVNRRLGLADGSIKEPEREFSAGSPRATPAKPAAAPGETPGANGVIPVLAKPSQEAADFILGRASQGVNPFPGSDSPKRFLSSLGIDWSVPEHKKTLLALLRDGKVQLSRADLIGAMDRNLVESSLLSDRGADFHFVHVPEAAATAEHIAGPTSELEALLRGTRSGPGQLSLVADENKIWKWNDAFDEVRVGSIADSMKKHGWVGDPLVVVDSGNGKYRALTGSHRLAAAEEVGIRVPAIKLDLPDGWKSTHDGLFRHGELITNAGDAATYLSEDGADPRIVELLEEGPATALRNRTALENAGRGGATDSLTGLLRGTQQKLAAGESLPSIGAPARAEYAASKEASTAAAAEHFRAMANAKNYATSPMAAEERIARGEAVAQRARVGERRVGYAVKREHPFAVKQLELAHDDALERAATAADPVAKSEAVAEAKAIERQMTGVGARPGAVEDVAAMAKVTTRVEKAAANLTETVGEEAPAAAKEHAKAFRAAEDEASRKTVARIARAADDHVGEAPLPGSAGVDRRPGPSGAQKVEQARQQKLQADAAFTRSRAVETEARIGAKAASKAADDVRASLPPRPTPGKVAPASGIGSKVLAAATTIEAAHDLGVPGIPDPHDIPVIGPMLSTYLKYRALRAAAGRFVGRVPATAEARAAALAARTKDKIAAAVDRSLGLVQRNIPVVRSAMLAGSLRANEALQRRAFDDGHPDAPKGASPQALAAVRMREIAYAATNPQAVVDKVRKETRGIVDPDLIQAMESHLIAMYQHLNDTAPKGPPPNPYTKREWTPSPADALSWGRRLAVANDPMVAFDALHAQTLTPDMADTMRKVYDKLFAVGQKRLVERAADLKHPVEYRQLLKNSLLFDVPLHGSLEPETAALLSTAHAPAPATPGPSPSSAGGGDISKLFQTSSDRRAAQR